MSDSAYAPSAPNDAVVTADAALPKVTTPGPLRTDQATVSAAPTGRPSSMATPVSVVPTVVIDRSGPASTTGAWLTGLMRITTSSKAVAAPSPAVRRRR